MELFYLQNFIRRSHLSSWTGRRSVVGRTSSPSVRCGGGGGSRHVFLGILFLLLILSVTTSASNLHHNNNNRQQSNDFRNPIHSFFHNIMESAKSNLMPHFKKIHTSMGHPFRHNRALTSSGGGQQPISSSGHLNHHSSSTNHGGGNIHPVLGINNINIIQPQRVQQQSPPPRRQQLLHHQQQNIRPPPSFQPRPSSSFPTTASGSLVGRPSGFQSSQILRNRYQQQQHFLPQSVIPNNFQKQLLSEEAKNYLRTAPILTPPIVVTSPNDVNSFSSASDLGNEDDEKFNEIEDDRFPLIKPIPTSNVVVQQPPAAITFQQNRHHHQQNSFRSNHHHSSLGGGSSRTNQRFASSSSGGGSSFHPSGGSLRKEGRVISPSKQQKHPKMEKFNVAEGITFANSRESLQAPPPSSRSNFRETPRVVVDDSTTSSTSTKLSPTHPTKEKVEDIPSVSTSNAVAHAFPFQSLIEMDIENKQKAKRRLTVEQNERKNFKAIVQHLLENEGESLVKKRGREELSDGEEQSNSNANRTNRKADKKSNRRGKSKKDMRDSKHMEEEVYFASVNAGVVKPDEKMAKHKEKTKLEKRKIELNFHESDECDVDGGKRCVGRKSRKLTPKVERIEKDAAHHHNIIDDVDCGGRDFGFCDMTEEYPGKMMSKMMSDCKDRIYRGFVSVPNDPSQLFDFHDEFFEQHSNLTSEVNGVPYETKTMTACDTEFRFIRPGFAKDTTGRWSVIVQTDDMPQRVAIALCRKPNQSCLSMSDCGSKSKCIQQYTFQHLLAFDPHTIQHHMEEGSEMMESDSDGATNKRRNPPENRLIQTKYPEKGGGGLAGFINDRCPTLRSFKFPSACTCHIKMALAQINEL